MDDRETRQQALHFSPWNILTENPPLSRRSNFVFEFLEADLRSLVACVSKSDLSHAKPMHTVRKKFTSRLLRRSYVTVRDVRLRPRERKKKEKERRAVLSFLDATRYNSVYRPVTSRAVYPIIFLG